MVAMAGACEECTMNCRLAHYNKIDLSPSVTRFFKVLVGNDFSQFLLLPQKFADIVKELVNQETKLEDSDGAQWTVTLSIVQNLLALSRGWQKFSLDHNLQAGDILVFNYIKEAHFVVHIFDKSCCEKPSAKLALPCNRARMRGNMSSGCIPFKKTDANPVNRENSSTSGVSGSNSKNSQLLPTTTNDIPNAEVGNGNCRPCLDNSFDMMIARDAVPGLGEERTCLYDLSMFEVQGDKEVAFTDKGVDARQCISDHTQTNMRSQAEADEDPTRTKDLKTVTLMSETDMGMMVHDEDLEAKNDMLLERDTDKAIDAVQGMTDYTQTSLRSAVDYFPARPEDLKLGTAVEETDIGMTVNHHDLKPDVLLKCDTDKGIGAGKSSSGHTETSLRFQVKSDRDPTGSEDLEIATFTETNTGMLVNNNNLWGKDDMVFECEKVPSADPSNSFPVGPSCPELSKGGGPGGNMSNVHIQPLDVEWESKESDGGACPMDCREELAGDTKKMLRKEHPDTRDEANSSAKRFRGLKPLSEEEIANPSPGPNVCEPVKHEPVDFDDIRSPVTETLTCLAVMEGRPHLVLPEKLPGITCRKGTNRKLVLLQDQERRLWPALYYYRSGFHVLSSGWNKLNKELNVQAGDHYEFHVKNAYRGIYQLSVRHQ